MNTARISGAQGSAQSKINITNFGGKMTRKQTINREPRDRWNSFMFKDAKFCEADIPLCPHTAKELPHQLITWKTARKIYNAEMRNGNENFFFDAFIHFWSDDNEFDGSVGGIWKRPFEALEIISHFAGIITPDFSTWLDLPDPFLRVATLQMRGFGYWVGKNGIEVINNTRWGGTETWEYCFSGLPANVPLAIGTVASGLKHPENRPLFADGLFHLIDLLHPPVLLIYCSANYDFFDKAREMGVEIIEYQSRKAQVFNKGGAYE